MSVSRFSRFELQTDEPLRPIKDGGLSAALTSHFGGLGFNLTAAIPTPNDQADMRIPERHRWVRLVGLHGSVVTLFEIGSLDQRLCFALFSRATAARANRMNNPWPQSPMPKFTAAQTSRTLPGV